MDTSTGETVVLHLDQFEVPEVLAGVRGVLDLALERCAPGSAAALEVCAAWEGLDAASATSLIVPTLPPDLTLLAAVGFARRLVRWSILRVEPHSAALLLAEALRHLDTAARILAAEEHGEVPPWA